MRYSAVTVWPPVEPWTELPDKGFLLQVLRARERHPELLYAPKEHIRDWVASRLRSPRRLPLEQTPIADHLDDRPTAFRAIEYARVLHNRGDIHPMRVASIIHGLMNALNVDDFAQANVLVAAGGSWEQALENHGVAAAAIASSYLVESGNHRLVAQHLLGIQPWCFVDAGPFRWS